MLRSRRSQRARRVVAIFCAAGAALACPSLHAGALERIKSTQRINLGYLDDTRPFSFKNDQSAPEGYAVSLCESIAASLARQLALPGLTKRWLAIDADERLNAIAKGEIDLLCTPMSITLGRRETVSFSLPVFAGGNRAAVRADAPATLRDVLAKTSGAHPAWRGSPAETTLGKSKVAVVGDTAAEQWLGERRGALNIDAKIVSVPTYEKGLRALLARDVDVLFGDRALMLGTLGTMDRDARANVAVIDRLFTHEPAALALQRNDDAFRLLVDRALSELYATPEFTRLYARWAGELDEPTRAFFVWSTLAR